jgi:hypothetical protein
LTGKVTAHFARQLLRNERTLSPQICQGKPVSQLRSSFLTNSLSNNLENQDDDTKTTLKDDHVIQFDTQPIDIDNHRRHVFLNS